MGFLDYFRSQKITLDRTAIKLLESFGYELKNKDYLDLSLNNLGTLIIFGFTVDQFSKVKFTVQDFDGNVIENDPLIELLKNPNYFQTQTDFLKQHLWFKMLGANYIYVQSPYSNKKVENTKNLINLYRGYIDFTYIRNYRELTPLNRNEVINIKIPYTWNGKVTNIGLKDVIPFYDISNNIKDGFHIESPSKMKGAIPVLESIATNLKGKKDAISFAGKYLVSNKDTIQGTSKSMNPDDKTDIEDKIRMKTLFVTNANVEVNNLAPDMRKLMLDESFSNDMVRLAALFGMNKDVLSLAISGSTYANQENGFVHWLQSKILSEAMNFAEGIESYFNYPELGKRLVPSIDHFPAMQKDKLAQTNSFKQLTDALSSAVSGGFLEQNTAKEITERFLKNL
jgi:hypothetical protein